MCDKIDYPFANFNGTDIEVYWVCLPVGTAPTTQRIMYVLSWRTVSAPTRRLFWYLLHKLQSNKGNKHQNNTQVSAETVHHESTYNVLFLTWHNESINDNKNDNLYTSSPCLTCLVFVLLMTSQSIPDDITITRQLWCDHVNNDNKRVRYWFYSWWYSWPVMWEIFLLKLILGFNGLGKDRLWMTRWDKKHLNFESWCDFY